jgi:predicted RecA/RadA family phage recombinase
MVVVPVTTAAQGELFAGVHEGVVKVAKATGTGHSLGAIVDWAPTPGNVVAAGNVSGNYTLGHCVEAAGSSATTIKVKLLGGSITAQAGA